MSQTNIVGRDAAAGAASVRAARRSSVLRPALMIGGVVVLVVATLLVWLLTGANVSTDDSYVDAARVSLSTDVSGLVGQVYVRDNQHVNAGDPLFSLGDSAYAIAVERAQAQLAQAEQDINAGKRGYAEAVAQMQTASVQVEKDQADLARYAAVVDKGGVTRATYDDARFTLQADQDRLAELQQQAGQQLVKLQGNPNVQPQDVPEYQTALAALHDAQRNLNHTIVHAPYSGFVTMVESLQPGSYLPAGTAAFGLVSDTDVFIGALPKEDQLTWVRPGQSVDISVDTYPGQVWKGEVESIAPVSGSEFSILPAQNSSGNWVKVVQRIPVRIRILSGPTDLPLRAGMSTEISIHTGHYHHLSDLF